jgi:hypothetical protein
MAAYDPRIDDIRHEGAGEWFVYLTPGWHLDTAHCFGENQRQDIVATMRRVRPCGCSECEALMIANAIDEVFLERKR